MNLSLNGTMICAWYDLLDKKYKVDYVDSLPDCTRDFVLKHSYLDKGFHHLNFDNARFINHADIPNVNSTFDSDADFAAKDIQIGEEITVNYYLFDESAADKLVIHN